eukprot:scaffold182_cov350-Prasinococcus_capsulatus_cf.AAC.3
MTAKAPDQRLGFEGALQLLRQHAACSTLSARQALVRAASCSAAGVVARPSGSLVGSCSACAPATLGCLLSRAERHGTRRVRCRAVACAVATGAGGVEQHVPHGRGGGGGVDAQPRAGARCNRDGARATRARGRRTDVNGWRWGAPPRSGPAGLRPASVLIAGRHEARVGLHRRGLRRGEVARAPCESKISERGARTLRQPKRTARRTARRARGPGGHVR